VVRRRRSSNLKVIAPGGWSKRTIILLVMQTLDNSIRLRPRERLLGPGVRLQTEPDPENPSPTYIEAAMHEAPGAQTAVIPGDSSAERAAGLQSAS
jgi:hypothetical protein